MPRRDDGDSANDRLNSPIDGVHDPTRKCNLIRYSEAFPDANVLLAECARLGLEGIVANGWIKVKTPEWKAANKYRAKLFEKS
jgi:hypothetical protein